MTQQEKNTIRQNIEDIKNTVKMAAEGSGRSVDDIRIVLATKTQSAERINFAAECGITEIGENRVQELLEKYELIDREKLGIHFIGTLQTNKVKYIIDKVSLIHSVNSIKLASEIEKQAAKHGKIMDVLVEVNFGGEESKTGICEEGLYELLEFCSKCKNLRVKGLMSIPPKAVSVAADSSQKQNTLADNSDNYCQSDNKVQINIESRQYFDKIVQIFLDISAKKIDNINMDILSLGMSADFAEAISAGSNMIRPGRAVFGERV